MSPGQVFLFAASVRLDTNWQRQVKPNPANCLISQKEIVQNYHNFHPFRPSLLPGKSPSQHSVYACVLR